jgi:hypothetical protein
VVLLFILGSNLGRAGPDGGYRKGGGDDAIYLFLQKQKRAYGHIHRRFMPFAGNIDMADEDLPGPQKRDSKKVCEERDAKKQRREEREPSPEY